MHLNINIGRTLVLLYFGMFKCGISPEVLMGMKKYFFLSHQSGWKHIHQMCIYLPTEKKVKVLVAHLCLTFCDPRDYSLCPRNSPGKNTGVCACMRAKSLQLCPTLCTLHYGLQSARLLCHGDSPGNNTWSGLLCPPPGDLPDPGMEPRSPALQADSLPSEPPGKPILTQHRCLHAHRCTYIMTKRIMLPSVSRTWLNANFNWTVKVLGESTPPDLDGFPSL